MNLLTEFKVKKSQIKTENVIKSEFNFIKGLVKLLKYLITLFFF